MICPEAHVGDANHLAMALGDSAASWQGTFSAVGWQDAEGALYSVASWDADDAFLAAVTEEPERPGWDVEPYDINMAAAARAQALVVVHNPVDSDGEPVAVPHASSSTILIIPGEQPEAMAAAARLVDIPEGGE
jgi:hypothetical protein